ALEALPEPRRRAREDRLLARQASLTVTCDLAQDCVHEARCPATVRPHQLDALAHGRMRRDPIQELELIGAQQEHRQDFRIRAPEVGVPLEPSLQVTLGAQYSVTKLGGERALRRRRQRVERLRQNGGCVRLILRHAQKCAHRHLAGRRHARAPLAHESPWASGTSRQAPRRRPQRFCTSFLKATPIKNSSTAMPKMCRISRARMGSVRRVMPSTKKNKRWPPSSTGMGKRFKRPRLMLMRAITQTK